MPHRREQVRLVHRRRGDAAVEQIASPAPAGVDEMAHGRCAAPGASARSFSCSGRFSRMGVIGHQAIAPHGQRSLAHLPATGLWENKCCTGGLGAVRKDNGDMISNTQIPLPRHIIRFHVAFFHLISCHCYSQRPLTSGPKADLLQIRWRRQQMSALRAGAKRKGRKGVGVINRPRQF
jgi:hypothetical protein